MSKVTLFPSFVSSYRELLKNKDNVYIVEFYHRDTPSEPSVSVINLVSEVFANFDDETYISIRFVGGTDLTFTEESYNTNLSNDAVIFSSKHDDGTYCIIEFKKE